MYAVTSTPLVSRTRATLRSAEFGFFGVAVYTRVHTPRRWGLPFRAAVLDLAFLLFRDWRTSCWIVGTCSPKPSPKWLEPTGEPSGPPVGPATWRACASRP